MNTIKEKTANWINWSLLFGYVAVVTFLASFHEPWMDELHAWVMARDMSFRELVAYMKVEGHFCLWSLILMPFAKAGLGVVYLKVVSIFFTTMAAALLLFKFKLGLLTKVAVLVSYPMIFLYPAISRCYCLIPFILLGIALTYKELPNKKYLFALFVGLLAHTHAFMEGMVLAMFLVYCYKIILPKYKEKTLKPADFGPLAVIVVFVLLAFLQVVGNPFEHVYVLIGNDPVPRSDTYKGLRITIAELFRAYSIIPNGVLGSGMKAIIGYSLAFIPMILLSFLIYRDADKTGRFILIVALGWQLLFSIFVYGFGFLRSQLPFVIILAVILMREVSQKENVMIVCLCVLVSISGYFYTLRNDIKHPFSNWEPLARAIEKNVPKGFPVYSTVPFGEVVSVYIDDPDINIVPAVVNSIKDDTFYLICNGQNLAGFEVDTLYTGQDCFWENNTLVKMSRDNEGE